MKVLYVINSLCAGGAEFHLLTLCRRLKHAGIEVAVAFLKEDGKGSRSLRMDFEAADIKVEDLGAERNFDPRCLLRLIRLIKEEKPDVIHTHLPRADFLGVVAKAIFPSRPWVCSVHDIYSASWSGKWSLPLFDVVWRRATSMVAISGAVRDWLVRERGVPAAKVMVIRYGIDAQDFVQPSFDFRKSQWLNGEPLIGSIGRLEARKGHDCLIKAMPGVLKIFPDATLVVAGHDPWGYRATLQGLVDRMGLNGHVRLMGFQEDVPSFLHAIDVFAFGSRSEGFGQVVIEAMAAGKPVVANRIPPMTEVVLAGETGLLVETENPGELAAAIVSLLGDPLLARKMGKLGEDRARTLFSAERMAEQTLGLYRSLNTNH